jgi:lipopolysaccharide/colanic/teichoic acid biosynthesis glycosyltransferase
MAVTRANPEHEQFMKHVISENDDEPMLKEKGNPDTRTTWIGKIIRATSLDEIPQLVNVLKGEMSLIGPRPPIPYEVEVYKRWHGGRFDSVPGLTGLWQVSGKNELSFKEMARLDIQYSRNLSFRNDLIILLKTPLVIWREFVKSIRS